MSEATTTPDAPPAAALFLEADLGCPRLVRLPFGTAAVMSRSHPTRGTPNQDAAGIIPAGDSDALLVVADGMGGTRQGGKAAATVIRELSRHLPVEPDELLIRTAILNGIESANRAILSELPSSGATLAAVEICGHVIRPYHVGDTVILVVGQRGRLKLQTVSHSPVGFAVESGLLDEQEALYHHDRHLILNAVGCPAMRIELGAPLELCRHDTVLLASDGLTDNLGLDEIIGLIRKGPLDKALQQMADCAWERMAGPGDDTPSKPDDLTLIAYRRGA